MRKDSCRIFLCPRRAKITRLFVCVLIIPPSRYFLVLFVKYGQLYIRFHLVSYNQAFAGEEKMQLFSLVLNMTSPTYDKLHSVRNPSGRWACVTRAPDWAASGAGYTKRAYFRQLAHTLVKSHATFGPCRAHEAWVEEDYTSQYRPAPFSSLRVCSF